MKSYIQSLMMTNAHLHFLYTYSPSDFKNQMVCFCAGNEAEFGAATSFAQALNDEAKRCFVCAGIHPWTVADEAGELGEAGNPGEPGEPSLGWLERLMQERTDDVAAIGECGIDLYTPRLKERLSLQLKVFEAQMALASRYEKPLVIHCRRSMQYFFKYASSLKKMPAVIFHAFPGTFAECESLLRSGINAYFSFGGVFLRGGKKALECVAKLPDDRLLLETDADEGAPSMIAEVFAAAAEARGTTIEELCVVCEKNFRRAFLC